MPRTSLIVPHGVRIMSPTYPLLPAAVERTGGVGLVCGASGFWIGLGGAFWALARGCGAGVGEMGQAWDGILWGISLWDGRRTSLGLFRDSSSPFGTFEAHLFPFREIAAPRPQSEIGVFSKGLLRILYGSTPAGRDGVDLLGWGRRHRCPTVIKSDGGTPAQSGAIRRAPSSSHE